MKKLIFLILTAMTIIGCGDDVTNINGYSEEEVRAIIDSTLESQDPIIKNDTIYQRIVDTVTHELVDTIYQRVVDTVTNELVDTIYQRVVDTVTHELVDTIYHKVVDTVYKELVDTIYQRVIDTVFSELEKVNIDISRPRDTSITLYDTTDGLIVSKTFNGVVFKNVFYEKAEYQYLYNDKRDEGHSYSAQIEYYRTPNTSFEIPDYTYKSNCSGNYKFACGIKGTVYYPDACGTISKPDYNNVAYRSESSIKKVGNWRLFDGGDAIDMYKYLDMVVSDSAMIYLSTITHKTDANGEFVANVAKYKIPNMTSANKDKLKLKYICAIDLK